MITTLSNECLKVTIDSLGAEIQSINKGGRELIWEGDPKFWTGHSPVLFPICGGLKDDKFLYDGKEYNLPKHGFAKTKEFKLESATNEKAVYLLCSDEETLKVYPFGFELKIIYTLDKNKVNVEYNVKNLSDGEMYYSIGAHEAYACPGGIDEYTIKFEKAENFDSMVLDGPLVTTDTFKVAESSDKLKLSVNLFTVDSLIFKDLKSRKAWLVNDKTGEQTEISYEGFDYLLLWTIPGAEYICIEPWCGIPDYVNSEYDITQKAGIIKVKKGETSVKTHSMIF